MTQKQELLSDISKKIEKIVIEAKGFQQSLEQGGIKSRPLKEDEEYLEANTENVLLKPFVEMFGYNTQSITDPNRAIAQHKINSRKVDLALLRTIKFQLLLSARVLMLTSTTKTISTNSVNISTTLSLLPNSAF